MKFRKLTVLRIAIACSLMVAGNALAAAATDKGFEIAARSDRTDLGFGASEVELKMILRNAAGQKATRSLRSSPRDPWKGRSKILDPDDQWLYLPALKRVKRISSSNKSGPFVGSEFAFEDFTAIELNKFDYTHVGVEACGDLQCDVLERTPRYENSGYTRQVAWVDQTDFQIRKVEFYDRRGDLLKVLELSDYRKYENGVWRAHRLSMNNVQTQKQTELIYENYSFDTKLADGDFVKGRLSRLR